MRDLLAELEKAVPVPPAEIGVKSSSKHLTCPYPGCPEQPEQPYLYKSSLNRHYAQRMGFSQFKTTERLTENHSLDIDINEECGFCTKSFTCLRLFITHLDKSCKVKTDCEKRKIRLSGKQRRTIERKDDLYKYSTVQLNQKLDGIKSTKAEESSVAADTKSYGNGMMKCGNKGATPKLLAWRSRNSGEGDEDSSGAGSSIINFRAFGHYRRLISR